MSIFILTLYLAILCFATVIGVIRYGSLDNATRLLVWYIGLTFLTEGIAITMSIFYHRNNLFLYHVYSPLQFLLLSFYFNYSDRYQRLYGAGWIIGIAGIVVSLLNSFYLQPLHELNTNFVVLESFLIIGMSLVAFYRLLISDELAIFSLPRFWFTSIFLVFWSFTFFYWLVGAVIYKIGRAH